MSDLFWTLLRIIGYLAIGLFSLIVALTTGILALLTTWLVIDARRARVKAREKDAANAAMHERIRMYLRQQLTAQE